MENVRTSELYLKFTEDLKSMSKAAGRLIRVLPHWISSRSGAIECLEVSPESFRGLSSTLHTVSKLGNTVQDSLCHSKIGSAVNAVGSMITFGMYKGCKKGMADFNNQRLNNVAGELAKDAPETKYVQETVLKLLDSVAAVTRDLEEMTRRANNSLQHIQQDVSSTIDESSDDYKSFLDWYKQIRELLQKFLTILEQSMEPNSQVLRLVDRNSNPRVLSESDMMEWIGALRRSLTTVETARTGACQAVESADGLLNSVLNMVNPSSANALCNLQERSNLNGPCSIPPDVDQGHTHEIDQWFRQISGLYTSSIEVAREVHRLLSENKKIASIRFPE